MGNFQMTWLGFLSNWKNGGEFVFWKEGFYDGKNHFYGAIPGTLKNKTTQDVLDLRTDPECLPKPACVFST